MFADSVILPNFEDNGEDEVLVTDYSHKRRKSLSSSSRSIAHPEGFVAGIAIGVIAGILVLATLVSPKKPVYPAQIQLNQSFIV